MKNHKPPATLIEDPKVIIGILEHNCIVCLIPIQEAIIRYEERIAELEAIPQTKSNGKKIHSLSVLKPESFRLQRFLGNFSAANTPDPGEIDDLINCYKICIYNNEQHAESVIIAHKDAVEEILNPKPPIEPEKPLLPEPKEDPILNSPADEITL